MSTVDGFWRRVGVELKVSGANIPGFPRSPQIVPIGQRLFQVCPLNAANCLLNDELAADSVCGICMINAANCHGNVAMCMLIIAIGCKRFPQIGHVNECEQIMAKGHNDSAQTPQDTATLRERSLHN